MSEQQELVQQALRLLGVQKLVLAIHDLSFPALPEEDTGWGSPYSVGGRSFLAFLRGLGFTGVQFGPQGAISPDNPCPYDGSMFSRNLLSISLAALPSALITRDERAKIVEARPREPAGRTQFRYAHAAIHEALQRAYTRFSQAPEAALGEDFATFKRQHEAWLTRDSLYAILSAQNQHKAFWDWSEAQDQRLLSPRVDEVERLQERVAFLSSQHKKELEAYQFKQLLLHQQHQSLRGFARGLGLALYGDLQVGLSLGDVWGLQHLFLDGYLMGAPPSRTNPDGQPWGYRVLDPAKHHRGGLAMMRARVQKMFAEFDGVRIDHPHGLIDPWVYQGSALDPLREVQRGARLFSSPGFEDHPGLSAHAIATREQLNFGAARYADDWLSALSPEQVERYATLFEVIASCAVEAGRSASDLICEVLSTMPYQVGAVLAKHGLGRFRVTQKANTRLPSDVYRGENASPQDWIMVGTHDTPPLWLLLDKWRAEGTLHEQAAYLAWRLSAADEDTEAMTARLLARPALLAQAKFAELFVGPAQNVSIFFADLFGLDEIYNSPGVISEQNWSLRLTSDYQDLYEEKQGRGAALDLPLALSMALLGRGVNEERRALAQRLQGLARLR